MNYSFLQAHMQRRHPEATEAGKVYGLSDCVFSIGDSSLKRIDWKKFSSPDDCLDIKFCRIEIFQWGFFFGFCCKLCIN